MKNQVSYQRSSHYQAAFLLQQIGFELASLAPTEWVEVCRLRCAVQGGLGPRSAVTDSVSRLAIV